MGFFYVLGALSILVAVVLILAVVIQNSKGGGLSSTFGGGGATQLLGARRSNEFIEKVTWYLAIALAVLAFGANIAGAGTSSNPSQLRMGTAIEDQIISEPIPLPDASSFEIPDAGDAEEGQ